MLKIMPKLMPELMPKLIPQLMLSVTPKVEPKRLTRVTSSLILYGIGSLASALVLNKAFANDAEVHEETVEKIEVIEVVNDHDFANSNYEILKREDFIGTSQNLSDVLKDVNGIQIRQISGIGNPVSISIRGSSAKQVQFFIDGQLVNDSQFGGFDINQLSTEQIESIEISKNQALGTGSTPIGGVIRINTFNPTDDTFKISAATGSFGYKNLSLLKNTAFKHHSLAVGGTYLASDNDYDYFVESPLNNPDVSSTEALLNNEFEKFSFFINDSAQIDQHQLRVNFTYNKQDKALPYYKRNFTTNTSHIEMDSLRYGFQYNWFSDIKFLDTLELEYYRDEKDEFYVESLYESQYDINDYNTTKQHTALKPTLTFDSFVLSPYVTNTQQAFTSMSENDGKPSTCNGITTCDIKAEQDQINVGARVDWESKSLPIYSYVLANHLREENSNIALNLNTQAQKVSSSDQYNTEEIGLSYGDKKLNATINWSNGLRTPSLYELFGDRGSFKGNDNLLPESSKTYNLTIKYDDNIVSTPFNVSSSIYHQSSKNAIVAIFQTDGTGGYDNVSSAELVGFEAQAGSQITNKLSLSLQGHIMDTINKSDLTAFSDKKLPGIYHQQYSIAVAYQITESWRFDINTYLDKDLYFNLPNKIETNEELGKDGNPADRFVTDLSLHWRINNYSANISCNNLFDEHYQDLANRPAQGRSVQLQFSIKDI